MYLCLFGSKIFRNFATMLAIERKHLLPNNHAFATHKSMLQQQTSENKSLNTNCY